MTEQLCRWCHVKPTPSTRHAYCGDECRGNARRAQWRASRGNPTEPPQVGGPPPSDPQVLEERALERRLVEAQRSASIARREATAAKSEAAELRDEVDRMTRELDLYEKEYESQPEWLSPPDDTDAHRGTLVAPLSDVHAGELVDPAEMDDFNAYNTDICDYRLSRFFDRVIIVARHYLAGVEYDGIVLPLLGDLVSGDIHDELEQTNELSTYETVEFLVPRLRAGIEKLAEEFGRVHVVSAPGNHGRDSKRPRSKGRSAHNADTHIARLLALSMSEDDITFDVPRSFDVDFEVYGYRFNAEHGDSLRFSGTSEIGALGPVKRGTLRKSRQRQMEGRPFEYSLVGHFHQLVMASTQGFVMNGTLKGYDEYARTWHLTPEPAQQALMVVTPEHGITVSAPVLVQKREEEGW